MSIDTSFSFFAVEEELINYASKAVLNLPFIFFYSSEDDEDEEDFDFPNYVSGYFYVYDERQGNLLKSYTGLTRSTNSLVWNASALDLTFDEVPATYYYEMGYIRTGGYEVPLRYGEFKLI